MPSMSRTTYLVLCSITTTAGMVLVGWLLTYMQNNVGNWSLVVWIMGAFAIGIMVDRRDARVARMTGRHDNPGDRSDI